MAKPTLIIMAAGMGSRFGGLKQIEPVDDQGHAIMDYSVFDAARAGFGSVVCVIKKEIETEFRAAIGDRIAKHMPLDFAYQSLDDLPAGFQVPDGRVKPWGTVQAVLSTRGLVKGPFAVINADDFYGRTAFEQAADFLAAEQEESTQAMIAYRLGHTLTEFGSVSRGVCGTDAEGWLIEIAERKSIEKRPDGAAFTEDGKNYEAITVDTPVSMNFWAFSLAMMDEFERHFQIFLEKEVPDDLLKSECFLPTVVDHLIREKKIRVRVLPTSSRWYGMTYPDDLPSVRDALLQLREQGEYPEQF